MILAFLDFSRFIHLSISQFVLHELIRGYRRTIMGQKKKKQNNNKTISGKKNLMIIKNILVIILVTVVSPSRLHSVLLLYVRNLRNALAC